MLFWLGLFAVPGHLPPDWEFGATAMAAALGLIIAGLLSSTFHLGHPERAWRTLSQWRSSWLSREAIASLVTFIPAIGFGLGWVVFSSTSGLWALTAVLGAVGAILTVICTAYIYRSLKPIPQWHNHWVVPNFLTLAAMSGALLLNAIAAALHNPMSQARIVVLPMIALALVVKLGYWRFIDRLLPTSTPETATGLGFLGRVRALEAPHTSENFLLKEMGFRVARRHAKALRRLAILCCYGLPLALSCLAFAIPGEIAWIAIGAAAGVALSGIFVERWLFFAEAKHATMLYYESR